MADRYWYLGIFLLFALAHQDAKAEDGIKLPIEWHVQLVDQGLETPVTESTNPSIIVRRICLHLAGRIPTLEELDTYLPTWDWSDLIDKLIESEEFTKSREPFWREFLCVETEEEEVWLRTQLEQNTPIDRRIEDWITHGIRMPSNQEELLPRFGRLSNSLFQEDWDCARCHMHPFRDISRDQFYERAAFFSPEGSLVVPRDWATVTQKPGDLIRGKIEDGPAISAIRKLPDGTTPRDLFADWYFHSTEQPLSVNVAGKVFQRIAGEYGWWFHSRNERNWTLIGNTLVNVGYNEKEFMRILMLARFMTSPSIPRGADPEPPLAGPKLLPMSREQWLRSIFTALGSEKEIEETMPGPDTGFLTRLLFLEEQLSESNVLQNTNSGTLTETLFQRILSRPPTTAEAKRWTGSEPVEIALGLFLSDEFLTIP